MSGKFQMRVYGNFSARMSGKFYANTHASIRIDRGDPHWYDKVISEVSSASGMTADVLVDKIKREHPFFETMNYYQVGEPDRIGIALGV